MSDKYIDLDIIFVVNVFSSKSKKNHLKYNCILLQLRDGPLFTKDLFNYFEEVGPRQKAGVVLLEILDEVVENEKRS